MTNIVEPHERFRNHSRKEIEAALASLDPANPIALEVDRLVEAYAGNFKAHVERLGYFPSTILHSAPRWPIEAVAMELMTQAIKSWRSNFR
jgi:hypothetical protein